MALFFVWQIYRARWWIYRAILDIQGYFAGI